MNSQALSTLTQETLTSLASLENETRRVFHGRGRCYPELEQICVDWLQGQVLVSLFIALTPDTLVALKNTLQSWTTDTRWQESHSSSLLLQHRYQENSPMECLWGEYQPKQNVIENGLLFQLDLGRNQNAGLFLDMRYGRKWVYEQAKDKRVLNLFAYTCGFSVAAIAGGADHVVNLDMAKSVLSKGRDNHRLNQHDLTQVSFFAHDIFKSWGKIKKYGPYDLIIIDPPTFQKGSFVLTKDYEKILRRLPDLLAENAQVLACVNDPSLTSDFLIDGMQECAPSLQFKTRLENPPEFPDHSPEGGLKALVFGN